jgi:hypothetical protein
MVDIEVEGIAKRNESAGGAGVAHGRVTFVVPSSSLQTRAHLLAQSSLNFQHPDPIFPSLHDPSTTSVTP